MVVYHLDVVYYSNTGYNGSFGNDAIIEADNVKQALSEYIPVPKSWWFE